MGGTGYSRHLSRNLVDPIAAGRITAGTFMAAGNVVPVAREIMKTLDRYIGISFLRSFVLIIIILVALFSFLELVSQLDDVGKGNFRIQDGLVFICLTMPRRMLDLMPISTLLGSIVALGMLADHGELLAMQAGGMSTQRICWSVLAAGTLLILLTGVLAEMIVPPLD